MIGGDIINERITHPISPVYNEKSSILILGTFPSVKSREGEFFYHHPQNRFWKLISGIYQEELPTTIEDKKDLLLRHELAVWDVIQSCEITGSSDSSIRDVIPNDISIILNDARIKYLIANGAKAYRLYMKYIYPQIGREIIKLPSTSPANATFSLDKLMNEWRNVLSTTSR